MKREDLSREQRMFIELALEGKSILVDACIGSGKTTAIQCLCDLIPDKKRVLYLTYNKLLKLDAKSRIKAKNVLVTNYHGFAWRELKRKGIRSSVQECLVDYVRADLPTDRYDILILDEYQDIDSRISEMLDHIKKMNPGMQVIAVGDTAQKIYDHTDLVIERFIADFMPVGTVQLEFTTCFRISRELAAMLGRVWKKSIVGVNDECRVSVMDYDAVLDLLSRVDPGDILCLGSNHGDRTKLMNELEERFPERFNKNTVWSKIRDTGNNGTDPEPGVAVFTTFDGCKGMERDICIVFDFDVPYWDMRTSKPDVRYEIMRNLFCVAASRGKERIVFVESDYEILDEEVLSKDTGTSLSLCDMSMETMFSFKLNEQVQAAFELLEIERVGLPHARIDVPTSDGLIDLTPCIGYYMRSAYFEHYDIDDAIERAFSMNVDETYGRPIEGYREWAHEKKVLYLTSILTRQTRYLNQVELPFITDADFGLIASRLSMRLPIDANAQVPCYIDFYLDDDRSRSFSAVGSSDAECDGYLYSLRFATSLDHESFLSCAACMIARDYEIGRLWNIYDDELWEVRIPDRKAFLDKVTVALTRGRTNEYRGSAIVEDDERKRG